MFLRYIVKNIKTIYATLISDLSSSLHLVTDVLSSMVVSSQLHHHGWTWWWYSRRMQNSSCALLCSVLYWLLHRMV